MQWFKAFFANHPRLRRLLAPSSFKVGCFLVAVFLVLGVKTPRKVEAFIQALDYRIMDTMLTLRGPMPTQNAVVIVDLDEKSLQKFGQWPWERSLVGKMISNLGAAQPKAIGFDIVFAEEDRTSPRRSMTFFREKWKQYLPPELTIQEKTPEWDHDVAFGEAIKDAPVVLGYLFQMEDDGLKQYSTPPMPQFSIPVAAISEQIGDDIRKIPSAYRAVLNVKSIGDNALTEGFFNVSYTGGIVRNVPLLLRYADVLYPSLTVEMLREGTGRDVTLAAAGTKLAGIRLGSQDIPTNETACMWVNFRGPSKTFPYVSASDVIEGRVPSAKLKDKYVLIGTSTQGLLDLRATPFSSDFPGVEVHATVIDNILKGDAFQRDTRTEAALGFTIILLGGLLLTSLLAFVGPELSGIAGIMVTVAVVVGNYRLFFLKNQLVGMAFPLLTLLLVFLAVTFFNYLFEGRQKRQIRNAFGRYLSPVLVDELAKHPEKLSLGGEEKELSVLFSDIRGFTTLSEALTAHELGTFLNEYFTPMTNIIMERKGYVDKYIGDAIMAFWNAPVDDPQHQLNAVRSAMHMMARLRELRKGWDARQLPPIDIGVGICTGPIKVGNMGSEQRFNYTVMGDSVNQASRLEGLNKDFGTNILIAEPTYEAVRQLFFCRLVDVAKPKGKTVPVKIYAPLCEGLPATDLLVEVQAFDSAFADYQAGQFAAARTKFEELIASTGKTKQYRIYLERCDELLAEPPANWDGVYTFTHK